MRVVILGVMLAAFAACTGDGSDIGPGVEPLPPHTYRVVVKDAAGRGVAAARVTLPGIPDASQVTGGEGGVDVFAALLGRQLVCVDATFASAAPGDRLGSLAFAVDAEPPGRLPFVVHLPDLAGSAGLELAAGTSGAAETLDDSGWSGAVISLAAGTLVDLGGAARAVLRTGSVRADHIPPLLLPGASSTLASRGVLVEPLGVGFAPAAGLSLSNDLGLGAGATAELFRLDPTDGEWRSAGVATVTGDGARLEADRVVRGGGMYAAAVPGAGAARLFGRVLRSDTARALGGLRLRAGQVVATTDGGGRFVLDGVPVTDGAGAATTAVLTVAGGWDHRPRIEEFPVDAPAGSDTDLGDLESVNTYATDMRLQLVERGQVAADRGFAVGTTITGVGGRGVTDSRGRIDFPAVEDGVLGYLSATLDPREVTKLRVAEGLLFVPRERSRDLQVFFDLQEWRPDGTPLVFALDPVLQAPISGVHVFRNRGGDDQFIGITPSDRIERYDLRGGEAILTSETTFEGQTVRSAFAIQGLEAGRLEGTVSRASRAPLGAFERHGLVAGVAPGAGPLRRVIATAAVDADRWLDAAMAGRSVAARAPVRREPSRDGGTAFELGVPSSGGVVIATSTADAGGRMQLVDLAFRADVRVDDASRVDLDLGAVLPATADFVAPRAVEGLDPRVPEGSLVFDLGVSVPGGRVLDVAREVGANLRVRGQDLVFALPALDGALAGGLHQVLLRGRGEDQGAEIEQRSYLEFGGPTQGEWPLLEVPIVASPAPAATLPVGGFEVRFALPADAMFGVVRLRSAPGGEARDWTCVVPSDSTSVRFRNMPRGPEILAPGSYLLEVTAVRVDPDGPLEPFQDRYAVLTARWVGLRPASRGDNAWSTLRFGVEIVQ